MPRVSSRPPAIPPPEFRAARDVMAAPAPAEIVQSIAWANCVTVLVSESSAGKTFYLLSLAAAISGNLLAHGRRVAHGSIAYISFEGDALGLRLRALEQVGHYLDHLYILRGLDPISPAIDHDRVELPSKGEKQATSAIETLSERLAIADQPPIVLVVIDTVRASMTGSEDNSEAVSAYLRAVKRLLTHAPGAGLILAHHAGWQDGDTPKKRERGSSAFRGNVDATLYLEAQAYDHETRQAKILLRTVKTRDGELPPDLHLIRRQVDLPQMASDNLRDGAVTSCLIELDRQSQVERDTAVQEAADLKTHTLDLRTLHALHDRGGKATSQAQLRVLVGGRLTDVIESLTRLSQGRFIDVPDKQRQPYTLTALGLSALNGRASAS